MKTFLTTFLLILSVGLNTNIGFAKNRTGTTFSSGSDLPEDKSVLFSDAKVKASAAGPTNPTVTAFAIQSSCSDGNPDDNGYLQISAVADGDRLNFSMGSTYTGPTDYNDGTNIDITGMPFQFGQPLMNPGAPQDYTIRVFNGESACFTDVVVTLNPQDCTFGCDCTEYLYLNDVGLGEVHKFSIDVTDGSIAEIGSPWMSGYTNPHGLGSDLNGYLYIGDNTTGPIYRVTCDGGTVADDAFLWNNQIEEGLTNIGSFGNYIITTGHIMGQDGKALTVFDACGGNYIGDICLNDTGSGPWSSDWGLQVLPDGTILASDGQGFGPDTDRAVWQFQFDPALINDGSNCVDALVFNSYLSGYYDVVGITSDGTHIYVLTRDNASNSTLVKIDAATGALVATQAEDGWNGTGWNGALGLVYAPSSGLLYVSGFEDCIAILDPATLAYLGPGNGTIPSGSNPKAVALMKECCPTNNNVTIDTTLCNATINETLFLQELINCDGVICEGFWQPDGSNTGLNYNSCNNSVTIVSPNACGTFTLESDGVGNNPQCGAFVITVNIELESVTAAVISGTNPTCATSNDPAPLSVDTPASGSGTVNYTWQSSTTSCTSGFTDIAGAPTDGSAYDPPVISQVTYYRLLSSVNGSCSTGMCADTSNCVTLTPDSGCVSCSLSDAGLSASACNDNSTSNSPGDDYITFNLNPMGVDIGSTYSVSVNNGGTVTLAAGGAATGVSYGFSTMFRLQDGSADGTSFILTVTDDTDNSCQITTTVTQSDCSVPVVLYSLGNRVFYDDDTDGAQGPGEAGVDGIQLQLLNADGSVYDSDPNMAGIQALTLTTANGGYYRFDDLPAGSYIVEIPAAAFASGQILHTYISSTGAAQEADPNNNVDSNDNGLDSSTGGEIRSGVVTLGGSEPTGEEEPASYTTGSFTGTAASDSQSNLTVDFGFFRDRDRPDCCDPTRPPCTEEPCHFISTEVYFGSGVTGDASGQSSVSADNDVDDGILFSPNLQISPGGIINLPIVFYNNTGADAYIRGWVDWNNDGDFDDPGEQVVDNTYPAATFTGTFTEYIPITIPANTLQNQDLASRWRISTDDINTSGPCGTGTCAADGEIEDYLLRANCPNRLCTSVTLSIRSN